jgi:hypothetical protein
MQRVGATRALGMKPATHKEASRAVSASIAAVSRPCAWCRQRTRTVHARRGALRVLLLVHVGAKRENRQAVRLRQVRRLPRAEALRRLQPIHARHLHTRQGRIRSAQLAQSKACTSARACKSMRQ